MGLYIITGPPRKGKTCYLTHLACQVMFDRNRTMLMQAEIQNKIDNGFTNIKTIPLHCVSANYDIVAHKFLYSPRYSRRINPYRLGFANPDVEVHFNLPYEFIAIDEAQKYFNSRMALYYPDWQSRWFEQHGHNNIDIFMATQRYMLIDPNIRCLSKIIEIVDLQVENDCFGKPCYLMWRIRTFENSELFDKYMANGRSGRETYTESVEVADYDVFSCYNSQSCKPLFYDGHLEQDFDYEVCKDCDESFMGYVNYLENYSNEYPEGFYKKRGEKL